MKKNLMRRLHLAQSFLSLLEALTQVSALGLGLIQRHVHFVYCLRAVAVPALREIIYVLCICVHVCILIYLYLYICVYTYIYIYLYVYVCCT